MVLNSTFFVVDTANWIESEQSFTPKVQLVWMTGKKIAAF